MRIASGLIACLVVVGAASAAPPAKPGRTGDQLHCVYDHLSDAGVGAIRDAFVSATPGKIEAAQVEVSKAHAECASLFTWTPKQRELAEKVAVHSAIADAAYTTMARAGFLDVGKVLALWRQLGKDELNAFLDPNWGTDQKFTDALKVKLKAAGVPDNPTLLESAEIILEQTTQNAAASDQWAAEMAAPATKAGN